MGNTIFKMKKNISDPAYMMRTCYVLMNVFMAAFCIFFVTSEMGTEVFAQTAVAEDMGLSQEISNMFKMFKGLADIFIKIAYGLMIIIFAVGMVKSGLTAQAAQQFGASSRVSGEIMNVIGGLVIFVFGMLSYPLVSKIIESVVGGSNITGNMSTSTIELPGIQ